MILIASHLNLQGSNIFFLDKKALLLHNEKRTTATTIVCVQPQLFQPNVSHHSHFCVHIHLVQDSRILAHIPRIALQIQKNHSPNCCIDNMFLLQRAYNQIHTN